MPPAGVGHQPVEGQWVSLHEHLRANITAIWATTANTGESYDQDTLTQLDSRANIVVIGSHATVFGNELGAIMVIVISTSLTRSYALFA